MIIRHSILYYYFLFTNIQQLIQIFKKVKLKRYLVIFIFIVLVISLAIYIIKWDHRSTDLLVRYRYTVSKRLTITTTKWDMVLDSWIINFHEYDVWFHYFSYDQWCRAFSGRNLTAIRTTRWQRRIANDIKNTATD